MSESDESKKSEVLEEKLVPNSEQDYQFSSVGFSIAFLFFSVLTFLAYDGSTPVTETPDAFGRSSFSIFPMIQFLIVFIYIINILGLKADSVMLNSTKEKAKAEILYIINIFFIVAVSYFVSPHVFLQLYILIGICGFICALLMPVPIAMFLACKYILLAISYIFRSKLLPSLKCLIDKIKLNHAKITAEYEQSIVDRCKCQCKCGCRK